MNSNMNIAAWMIAGGPNATDSARERNLAHLRALKASRQAPIGLGNRIRAAVAAIRPSATPVDPACCPA